MDIFILKYAFISSKTIFHYQFIQTKQRKQAGSDICLFINIFIQQIREKKNFKFKNDQQKYGYGDKS